jgi:hypothetical protein
MADMRRAKMSFAALIVCAVSGGLSGGAAAGGPDQMFHAPEAGTALHALDGKTYWETFAMCFASANAVLEKAARERNESEQRAMSALADAVLERGIARLVADRVVFEGEAEEIFLARAAGTVPAAGFADACRVYIKDHDSRFGTPK